MRESFLCCSLLFCVQQYVAAVCCSSVLQCVADTMIPLRSGGKAGIIPVLQCVLLCCKSTLGQCIVAVCCSALSTQRSF